MLSQYDPTVLSLVELRSGEAHTLAQIDALPLFSRDSRFVAGATDRGTFIWKTNRGAKKFLGGDAEHPLAPISFSPDARFLAVKNERGRFEVRRVRNARRVFVAPRKADSLAWLDSRTLELKSAGTTKRVSLR